MLESVIGNLIGKGKLGAFCTQLKSELGEFELKVDGLGKIRCPIMPKTAKALIALAKPAAFGKKNKTLYDPSVRDVWEVTANKISIAAPFWEQKLSSVLQTVHKDLNMPNGSHLTAHLHNLLIYERNQFFAPHQDSEKYDGMVATLVVLLPSNFSGGSLKIDQHGDKRTFDTGIDARSHLTFIAFYADCHHEVTKVTAGYRVALTYNLVLEGVSKSLAKSPSDAFTNNIKSYFSAKKADASSYRQETPRWLVYLFNHQYTQKSLNWKGLKGADRESAAQFLATAKELDLVAHLALADVHEAWTAEEDDFDDNYRRRYWDSEDDEDEDEKEEPSNDPATMDVQDLVLQETTLCHWVNEEGKHCEFGPKYVRDEMVCWSKANDEFKPTKAEYEGYMGNYGNTVDKWYHRAAIILWPKATDILSRFEITPTAVLESIAKQLKEDLAIGQENLLKILPHLQKLELRDPTQTSLVIDIALKSSDSHLAERVLLHLGVELITAKTLPRIVPLISEYGEDWFIEHLKKWSNRDRRYRSIITDLKKLVSKFDSKYKNISSWLLSYQRERIIEKDKIRVKSSRKDLLAQEQEHMKTIVEFLHSAVLHTQETSAMIDHILLNQRIYSAINTADVCLVLNEVGFPLKQRQRILTTAKTRLAKIVTSHRAKNDWSITSLPSCTCHDCKNLKDFLLSSSLQSYTWPLAKDRRQHIHIVLDGSGLPVTHVTLRQGSPQKLVLNKTPELFKIERAERIAAEAALKEIEKNLS